MSSCKTKIKETAPVQHPLQNILWAEDTHNDRPAFVAGSETVAGPQARDLHAYLHEEVSGDWHINDTSPDLETETAFPRLSIVVPCYNEEEVLPETTQRLTHLLQDYVARGLIDRQSAIYYVDDGSKDKSWTMIEELAEQNEFVKGIKLSGNQGHQNALMAGLLTVPGDLIISVDADLQDDLNAIEGMLKKAAEGAQIVYGVRVDRTSDSFFKKLSAEGYYKTLKLLGVDIVFNHADYRLMSRQAIEALKQYPETNLFLRGLIPQLGFKTACVEYTRAERFAGVSKYPIARMLSLAMDGITSFSVTPLRMITMAGGVISLVAMVTGLYALGASLFTESTVPGWASTVVPMYFLGGIQLLSLGVIGEYLGKTYMEVKRRPNFIIEKKL